MKKYRRRTILLLLSIFILVLAGCTSSRPKVFVVPPSAEEDTCPYEPESLPEPLPREIPQPPKKPKEEYTEAVSYSITPEGGYRDDSGYVTIGFQPAEDGERGGRITIRIGKKEIENANTKWFTYRFILDGIEYIQKGQVSVPFVRGRDNLWWNEETILLPGPMEGTLSLTVKDRFFSREYGFTLEKRIEKIPKNKQQS